MPAANRRQRAVPDIWPGFVDAFAAILIIIIFLIMVFTLAQYFLTEALSGRDEALERLNRTVAELQDMLALEQRTSEELRLNLSQVSGELQVSVSERDRMSAQLAELMPERDALESMLATRTNELAKMTKRATAAEARAATAEERFATAEERANKFARELEDAFKTIQASREKIEIKLAEIASLMRDLEALRTVRVDLEKKVADLARTLELSREELVELTRRYKAGEVDLAKLRQSNKASQEELAKLSAQYAASQKDLTALRDRSKALTTRLSTQEERTALAQKEIEKKEIRLKEALGRSGDLEVKLTEEQKLSARTRRQVELLNRQIAALRQQLARIEAALEISEKKSKKQRVQIADLGRRLNLALASKVEELARYRSEFFGRLREVLGNRKDIRVVGDRFVFQSEVLFRSGSSTLSLEGRRQIGRLAKTLLEISKTIPKELNWILRVDGHTDKVPISTARFPSNWELSAERAISVIKHMMALGVPAWRLMAAGFGEYQPIDARDDEIGYRRNRRIEFKLTER